MQIGMVFSQLKSQEQQILQSIESSKKFLDKQLIALTNHMRAYLYEYGITSARGKKGFTQLITHALDDCPDNSSELPNCLVPALRTMWERYNQTLTQIADIEKQRHLLMKQSEPCQRLLELEGVGEVCATMLFTNLGDGKGFKNGRQASAYVGVTPKQYSSGGKVSMRGIDKAGGNKDLRAALYQDAMSVISRLPVEPKTTKQAWLTLLINRVGIKKACIALANKTVRTVWALLFTGQTYRQTALSAN